MKIELKEFYNRINYLCDNTNNQISIVELKDIEKVLNTSFKNISYNIYFYDNEKNLNEFNWVDVEGVNDGWLHTLEEVHTEEDVIRAVQKSALNSLRAIGDNLEHNDVMCFEYRDKGKILFHIVELAKDLTNRVDFSIFVDKGDK